MRKLFAFAICAALFASCTKNDGTDYIVTEYDSTDIPQEVPYYGGTYKVSFKTDIESRAKFENWQYRLHIGDKVTTEQVTSEIDSIEVVIDTNYDADYRYIAVETALAGDDAEWQTVLTAKQASALVKVGDYYWTKGNVALRNGKFDITEKSTDKGLYFFAGSKYGIPSDGAYAGTAYTPEPVQVALAAAKADEGFDVCKAISPKLRLPSRGELENLAALGFFEESKVVDGIRSMSFDGSDMLLPYAGFMGLQYNEPTMVSSYGVYWGDGENFDGNNLIYVFNAASEMPYSLVDFDRTGENTGSVRCVRNIAEPAYVSHSPESAADHKEFELTVETTPGDFKGYLVEVEASDNAYDKATVTAANPTAKITIPANEYIDSDVTWKIFVNGHFTGKTFVQPAMTDYVFYTSHTPTTKQTYEAFTLTVTCKSDRDSFTVEAKGSDNTNVSATGSKSNLAVALAIPENTAETERTFKIFVNGEDTGKSIVQEGKPAPKPELSVIWSTGYLTIKDGAYTFADKNAKGMYFKWKSKWGVPYSSTSFGGKAYGPDEASYTKFTEVPQMGDTDPCSLVAPAGTWYMPTKAQITELIAAKDYYVLAADKKSVTIESQDQLLVFVAAGSVSQSSGNIMGADKYIMFWSGDAADSSKAVYYMFNPGTTPFAPKTANSTKGAGMQIRCVRNKIVY